MNDQVASKKDSGWERETEIQMKNGQEEKKDFQEGCPSKGNVKEIYGGLLIA